MAHGKNITYWENYHATQCEILCRQVFKKKKSEIIWYQRVVKKEKISRRKYSVDTLAEAATGGVL